MRVQDVRDAYRLIGECRDLGGDPALWHRRMLEGVCQLVGAAAATGGEGLWAGPDRPVVAVSAFDSGLDARGRERLGAFMRELGPSGDPFFQALQHLPGRLVTHTRRDLVADAVWYRSISYNEYRRPAGADHTAMSVYHVPGARAISVIAPQRTVRERDFSPREARLLNFFHSELGPLIGRSLVSGTESGPERLTPRLRQTLACLTEGDSERQVALRLGLSHATTHQYVTALYRHFGVRSRAQLMAYVIKRIARGKWKAFGPERALSEAYLARDGLSRPTSKQGSSAKSGSESL